MENKKIYMILENGDYEMGILTTNYPVFESIESARKFLISVKEEYKEEFGHKQGFKTELKNDRLYIEIGDDWDRSFYIEDREVFVDKGEKNENNIK